MGATSGIYAIRPATEAERLSVASSWRTILSLSMGRDGREVDDVAGTRIVQLGRTAVARGWLVQALHDRIDRDLDDGCGVLVADHPDAPGYPLGWIAYLEEPLTLLAMHVDAKARGAWVGRELLRHVLEGRGEGYRCSVLTPKGRKLLEYVRAGLDGQVAA